MLRKWNVIILHIYNAQSQLWWVNIMMKKPHTNYYIWLKQMAKKHDSKMCWEKLYMMRLCANVCMIHRICVCVTCCVQRAMWMNAISWQRQSNKNLLQHNFSEQIECKKTKKKTVLAWNGIHSVKWFCETHKTTTIHDLMNFQS